MVLVLMLQDLQLKRNFTFIIHMNIKEIVPGSLAGGFSFAAAAALGFGVLAFGTSAE